MLSKKAFNATLALYFQKASMPTIDEIVVIMKEANLNNVNSDKTFYRRASTILGWVNWIVEQIEE